MNTRQEGMLNKLGVRFLIDPVLSSPKARNKLKSRAGKESRWMHLVLRHIIDPTTLPPPSYTRARADAVYQPALRRCLEYIDNNRIPGDIAEFGTLMGYTARWLAGMMVELDLEKELLLFDSFEGLPEIEDEIDQSSYDVAVNQVWFKGSMKVDEGLNERIDQVLSRILPGERLQVVKGYFEDTLLARLPKEPLALVHLDCDLYSSAKFVLDTLIAHDLLQDGTLLIMDDYNCNRANPGMGERRALEEAFRGQERFRYTEWFPYGWHGQVFLVHESGLTR